MRTRASWVWCALGKEAKDLIKALQQEARIKRINYRQRVTFFRKEYDTACNVLPQIIFEFSAFSGDCCACTAALWSHWGSQVSKQMSFHGLTLKQQKWDSRNNNNMSWGLPPPSGTSTLNSVSTQVPSSHSRLDDVYLNRRNTGPVTACGLLGVLAVLRPPGNRRNPPHTNPRNTFLIIFIDRCVTTLF